MKRTLRQQRGSVLLMVVGLLTIIYMLGGTFLIVASLDRRQTRAITRSGRTSTGAQGLVELIQNKLRDDLHTADDGRPYGNLPGGAAGYLGFIDYPTDDSRGDYWLSSSYYKGISRWRRVGDIPGVGDMADSVALGDPDADFGDADGDGEADGIRFDTGMVDPDGNTIYATVRVVDTSAFVNTSVCWGTGQWTSPTSPVLIDFLGMSNLKYDKWRDFHRDRANGWDFKVDTAQKYLVEMASRVLHPQASYRPFEVADEAFLRDANPDSLPRENRVGRLAKHFVYIRNGQSTPRTDPELARQMTTRNISRSLLRYPDADHTARIQLNGSMLETDTTRQYLYRQMISAGADAAEAAHMVANLWAYTSNASPDTEAFAFAPVPDPNAVGTVYGITPQLVITEAFIYSEAETKDGDGDSGYGIAIELMNPGWVPVTTESYVLKVGTESIRFNDSTIGAPTVDPGQKIVLYHFDGKIKDNSGDKDDADLTTFEFNAITAPKFQVEALKAFDAGTVLTIEREITVEAMTYQVPVDQLKPNVDELEFPYTSKTTHDGNYDTSWGASARRDDQWEVLNDNPGRRKLGGRARSTLAIYRREAGDSVKKTNHKLGSSNGVSRLDSFSPDGTTEPFEGFSIHRATNGFVRDLGELVRLYRTGPDASGAALPQKLRDQGFWKDLTRGKLDLHAVGTNPISGYPSLPWAAILLEQLEVIPTDTGMADEPRRIYGRININTAEKDVLMRLPWPNAIFGVTPNDGVRLQDADVELLVDYILAYRDGRATMDNRYDFANRAGTTGITGLRSQVGNANGFLTEAEVAIPLYLFARTRKSNIESFQPDERYTGIYGVDRLYHAISNLITVRSDTYAVLVELRSGGREGRPVRRRRYLGLIDRSNCNEQYDMPAIELFTELK
ncbi:MAG: hypothetical protein ACOCZE_05220 [Planctomycetota bacterium]